MRARCVVRPQWTPADLRSSLYAWYRADGYTLASGKASVVTDKSGNGRDLTASGTAGLRSTPRSADLHLNGRPSLFCDATQNQFLGSAATAADWTLLHDFGAGGRTVWGVVMAHGEGASQQVGGTFNGTAADPSFSFFWDGNSEQFKLFVCNGSAAIVNKATTASEFVKGAAYYYVIRMNADGTHEVRINGSVVAALTDTKTSTASSSAPTYPLRLGQYAGAGSAPLGGQIGEWGCASRSLTATEVTRLEGYLRGYINPAVSATAAAVVGATPLTGAVKVVCVGDSITEGESDAATYVGGYRGRMYSLASGYANFTLDLVGPVSGGSIHGSGFADDVHSGRSGSLIRDHYTGGTYDVASFIPSLGAQVCVLMLGMNNAYNTEANYSARDNARDLVDLVKLIASLSPGMRFVVCNVTPQNNTVTGRNRRNIDSLNDAIKRGLADLTGSGILWSFCDMFTACGSNIGASNQHPNDTGYLAMGAVAWPALRYVCGYA